MCAMIPMLRTMLRSVVISTATSVVYLSLLSCKQWGERGPGTDPGSPAVVGESLVGFGHLVCVLAALDRGTQTVGGVQDLVHQALGHRLLATRAGVRREPAQGERCRATGLDLDRHLVGGATDAAALHLDARLHVVQSTLQRDDRIGAGLAPGALERGVDDALRDLLLAVDQDLGDQLGDEGRVVDRVDDDRPLRGGTLARH